MSKDIRLGWPCPHITVEEPISLGSDRRSLVTQQPIGSSGLVRILVNNEFYVPKSGFHVPASLLGDASGPFYIRDNENVLTVESNAETATVELPVGYRVSTKDVLDRLIPSLDTVVAENSRGRLLFSDRSAVGAASRIKVSGSAAPSLGFGSQYQAFGKTIYPPWDLVGDDGSMYPVFRQPLRNNPFIKVTYSTSPKYCLRCRGTLVENDWRFDTTGNLIFIENEDLLYQAALKILLTRKGSNPYHTWYGASLVTRIGHKAVGMVASLLMEDAQRALSALQKQQAQQARYQQVTLRERLYRVASVRVLPHNNDPTAFLVDVVVVNASGKPVSLTVAFSVPGVVALSGSTGQRLLTS